MSKDSSGKWNVSTSYPTTIGVLIPTYRRSQDLLRCLEALKKQHRMPSEVLVVVQSRDDETRSALSTFSADGLDIRIILVDRPGTVHAHNVAIEACTADVLAMTDDDTVASPQWLSTVLRDFQQDPQLGGLGGRDRCLHNGKFDELQEEVVGKLQWFGRPIGNHHRGFGTIREVDLLKGANMSFRKEALAHARCDPRLRGQGAQPSEDVSLGLAVKRNGWKLAYDPAALVDHYAGERTELRHYSGIHRLEDAQPFEEFAYNEVIAIWDFLPVWRRPAYIFWSLIVGTRVCPGLLQAVRFTPALGFNSWFRFVVALKGKLLAFRDLLLRRLSTSQQSSR